MGLHAIAQNGIPLSGMDLRACYAMSGTDVVYGAKPCFACYAMQWYLHSRVLRAGEGEEVDAEWGEGREDADPIKIKVASVANPKRCPLQRQRVASYAMLCDVQYLGSG
eukprot:3112553-Rhodomonas_salina.6